MALKNVMELALMRHEKEVSVRQQNIAKDGENRAASLEKERKKVEVERQAEKNLKQVNREQLVEHKKVHIMLKEAETK